MDTKLDACQNSSWVAAWCGQVVRYLLLSDQRLTERGNIGQISIRWYKEWIWLGTTLSQIMFPSNSPYSPFFTSGLLCHSIFDGIRRGSLPTDNSKDVNAPFIFSNQPEYRSFLSLDLAESQSMRSASLKRKLVAPPLVFGLFPSITQLIVL
jgi:hypothetical protein